MRTTTSDDSSNPAGEHQPASADDSTYTRLHISPLDAELLKAVVPASVLPNARGISYHSIATFPEKRYGYVELPSADAEKIKRKLNGSTLRGFKMRVDKAKPESRIEPEPDTGSSKKKSKKEKRSGDGGSEPKPKKQKREHDVLEGVELQGRKVKRGWTVTDEDKIKEKRKSRRDKDKDDDDNKKEKKKKDKRKQREERSKYTDKEECLIKTKLPAKGEPAEPEESDRKKRKKGKSRETVIHEFANTTKFPTFLRANKPSEAQTGPTEFVEGKGWVDQEGNVVEAAKTRKSPKLKATKATEKKTPVSQDDDTTSSSGSSAEDGDDDVEAETRSKASKPAESSSQDQVPAAVEDDTSSSSGSSEDEDDNESTSGSSSNDGDITARPPTVAISSPPTATTADASRPKSSGSNPGLHIQIPPVTPAKIHPLEALYKRNKDGTTTPSGNANDSQPFSFFGAGNVNDDIDDDDDPVAAASGSQMPMTPFTQQEFEWRNVRSAAPTPDTAHPSRMKNFWGTDAEVDWEGEGEGADGQGLLDETVTGNDMEGAEGEPGSAAGATDGPGGDFQKWFWENRRDLNRSWMQRRKTAAKEKRHRENKSRAAKAL